MIVLEVNVVITNNNKSIDCFGLVFFFLDIYFVIIKFKKKLKVLFILHCVCVFFGPYFNFFRNKISAQ